MFGNKKIKYQFVSEIDQFLQQLKDKRFVQSDAQIAEAQKYQRINTLRDVANTNPTKENSWKDF